MRRLSPRQVVAGLALGILACVVAACGSTTLNTTTTTTTTTTLPVPIPIYGTKASGFASFEGKVSRVPVSLLSAGRLELPSLPPGAKVQAGTFKVAIRQFGSGPALVLAAGAHASMSWWDPQFLQKLASSYQVTIFDYPSVGYSTSLGEAPSVERYGDALAGLIAALGLHNVTILGWGMGGEVALSAVERHPGLALCLVLADTTMGGRGAVAPAKLESETMADPSATMDELSNVLFPSGAVGSQARQSWLTDISALQPDVVTFPALSAQAAAQAAFLTSDRVARRIGRVKVPAFVLGGGKDPLFPLTDTERLARAIPGAKLIVEPDAGYGAIFQDQVGFLSDLTTFMAKVTTSSTTTTTTTVP